MSNASVVVTWPVFVSAAAVATFVDDATQHASNALQSGDTSAALQVVGALAQLLNSDSSAAQDASDASDQRASLLAIVASAVSLVSDVTSAAAPAALETAAAAVSQLVAVPTQLSEDASRSALAVLGTIASAGVAVTPAAAQSVASALSAVALAPADTSSASGGAGGGGAGGSPRSNSSATYTAVLSVLTSLASSQSSTLVVTGQAPATVTTPTIQMSVGLDDPDSSRLYTEPLSAPGSNSSFEPLPSGALAAAGGASVNTLFLSLAFDAHGGADSNNTGGLTRLSFTSAATGEPVLVNNLSSPVLFTMPASTLRPEQHSSCAWWDDTDESYKTDGCSSLPSPRPPDHELIFLPGFAASAARRSDLRLAAWNISGPAMASCEVASLDCSNATIRTSGKLQLGGSSTLACGNATDTLRAFTGAKCALRDTKNNSAPCFWNVTAQAFSGVGCVVADATRCACSHLTDFTSSPRPNIPVASLSDMISLDPASLLTKLKLLFIVVISLFGSLHIGAGVAYVMDRREKESVAERLLNPACGYRVADDGAWLWRFGLDPLPGEIAAPHGPAVMLSEVLGIPFARLRAALPDELLNTDFAAALGRRHGFSISGMSVAKGQHSELLRASGRRSSTGGVRTPRFSFMNADSEFDKDGPGDAEPREPRRSSYYSAGELSDGETSPRSPPRHSVRSVSDGDVEASPPSRRRSSYSVGAESEYGAVPLAKRRFSYSAGAVEREEGADRDLPRATRRFSYHFGAACDDDEVPRAPRRSSFYVKLTTLSPTRRGAIALHANADAAQAAASEGKAGWEQNTYTALEELTGTALVIAFLQVTQLLPVVNISRMRGAAAIYFEELKTPSGLSFDELSLRFVTLLSPGILNTRQQWWIKARLWKLILSQHADGFFDPTSTVAFALEARSSAELALLKPTWMEQLSDRFAGIRNLAADMAGMGEGDGAVTNERLSGGGEESGKRPGTAPRRSMTARDSASGLEEVNDDPLYCSPSAVIASMPRRLVKLRQHGSELQLDRLWATLCCSAFLQSLNVSWLASDGDLYPVHEVTIVDAAQSWIEAHAARYPPIGVALADGEVANAAKRTVLLWHRAWTRRVGELRRVEAITEHRGTSLAHRASSEMVRAITTKHSTFAVFLSA